MPVISFSNILQKQARNNRFSFFLWQNSSALTKWVEIRNTDENKKRKL